MKKSSVMNHINNISGFFMIVAVFFITTISCEKVLDQEPVTSFNEFSVFDDVKLAQAALSRAYARIYYSDFTRVKNTDAMTDLVCSRFKDFEWCNGTLSPSNMGYFNDASRFDFLVWTHQYGIVKDLNVLLANIDNVPTKNPVEEELKMQIKGQALFLRALIYTNLMRTYGGLVLMEKPYRLGDDYFKYTRATLDQTKDFILNDIEQAIDLLPAKDKIQQGRATKGAAAALKSRLLLFCASKLVNGGYESKNPLVSLQVGSQEQRWRDARDAAKSIMDGVYGNYGLAGTTADPPANMTEKQIWEYANNFHLNIFVQRGAWNNEVIYGLNYSVTGGNSSNYNTRCGPNGYQNNGWVGASEEGVRMFEMANGSEFVWDKYNPGENYVREATGPELKANPFINPYYGREPRFYATILYHGCPWQKRLPGWNYPDTIQTGYFVKAGASYKDQNAITPGLDTRQSPLEPWNSTMSGYFLKKFMDPTVEGRFFKNENAWIIMRYAEVLLNYAEACIELGELQNGLNAINTIRNRAGLPDKQAASQDEARKIVRHERDIELFGEDSRWFDIRRWMICEQIINHDVYKMNVYQWTDGKMRFEWDKSSIAWKRKWLNHFYWVPILFDEISRAPQLQQNPGY